MMPLMDILAALRGVLGTRVFVSSSVVFTPHAPLVHPEHGQRRRRVCGTRKPARGALSIVDDLTITGIFDFN